MLIQDELNQVFREVFHDDSIAITPETTAPEIREWDLFSHVTLLMAAEDHFKIEFEPRKIMNLPNAAARMALVEKKLTQKHK